MQERLPVTNGHKHHSKTGMKKETFFPKGNILRAVVSSPDDNKLHRIYMVISEERQFTWYLHRNYEKTNVPTLNYSDSYRHTHMIHKL